MPMSSILLPGELPPGFWVPLVRMRFRLYGSQMAEGVTPRLEDALQQGVDAYYKVFWLRTQVMHQNISRNHQAIGSISFEGAFSMLLPCNTRQSQS
jgi:hypothetical protein